MPGRQVALIRGINVGRAKRVAMAELRAVADDPGRLLVAILDGATDRARLKPLAKADWAPDALSLGTRVAYLWCARGMLESPLAKAVGKALGDAATTRNWATLTRLHALATEENA